MSNQLFGIIPAGHPVVTEPVSSPSEVSAVYTISTARPVSHIVVFMLPGVALPPDTAAAIYFAPAVTSPTATGAVPDFRFLGGVGPGKESAIFKIKPGAAGSSGDGTTLASPNNFMIAISIEEAGSVASRIQAKASESVDRAVPSTTLLAQRIIQNAFNFLSGFSGTIGHGGVEVVPLKAFQEWWKKFEARVRSDPGFLERQQD
ncbi:hypothetical protein SODALDRAFT_325971 [Sodiomyces alkalinus F11]|uniref:Uncharacterized protein n=1 Tax=Sodiomyces alkalinus (strain CBS 110278 / VKM F-3762 / F11) TaxID=1314773 RepID=A0A3N2Q4T9_SODAK|nr:hypothetical protein SODALDRAFT_325971 [Sodiomyces alkalinus F11]ROT41781.1 hypothetical protein SODALDRAFT_325971 [Sodiomyces alkalinus F11]